MIDLKPFFCYYGGKWRVAKHYPAPVYRQIIEPFAGAAGYSLRYPHKKVWLYDLDEKIVGLWKYLIGVKASEILRLPGVVHHVNDLKVCQEAKWLIGFWLNKGSSEPYLTPSRWMRDGTRPNSYWGVVIRQRIASQVGYITHWKVRNSSYENIPDCKTSWFIDPPYQSYYGRRYRYSEMDYRYLADWCRSRRGQVVVCEREGADWLDFKPFRPVKSNLGQRDGHHAMEVVWYYKE